MYTANKNSAGIECAFSFADLYEAAFDRLPEDKELEDLYALPNVEKNKIVGEWAKHAGWSTDERLGDDGETYLAFWPEE
jgi:hypothetical protein